MATTTAVTKENLFELTKLIIEQTAHYKVLDDLRIQNPDGNMVGIKGSGDKYYTILVRRERVPIPTPDYVYLTPFKDNSAKDMAREWFFMTVKVAPGAIIGGIMRDIFKKAVDGTATEPNTVTVISKISGSLTEALKKELVKLEFNPKDIGYIIYNGATKTASFTSPILEDKECSKKHSDKDTFSSPMHEAYPSVSYKAWGVVQKTILAILDSTDISEWAENATVQNCQMASAVLTLSWKLLSQISGLVKELFNRDLQVEREGELLRDMESYANIERYLSVTPLSPAIKPEEASKPNPANAYVIPGSSGQTVQAGGPPPVQQWGAQPVGPASYNYGYGAPPVPTGPAPQDGFRPAGSLTAPPISQRQAMTRFNAFNQTPPGGYYGQPVYQNQGYPVAPVQMGGNNGFV